MVYPIAALRAHWVAVLARLTVLFTVLLASGAAAEPVLTPIKPCYVSVQVQPGTFVSEPMLVGGSGFAPDTAVDILVDGFTAVPAARAGADGVLVPRQAYPPVVRSGVQPFMVTVLPVLAPEYAMPLSLSSRIAALTVAVKPKRARPSQTVRFSGRGFTGSGALYGHYLFHGALKRTVRLAPAPRTRCGAFAVRRPQFPFQPRKGVWTLQVDQHRRLSDEGPLVRLAIDVRRRPRTR